MATSLRVDLKKNGKVYTIKFDEFHDLDTVECEGKLLSTNNRVVQQVLNNELTIRRGLIPKGFEKA